MGMMRIAGFVSLAAIVFGISCDAPGINPNGDVSALVDALTSDIEGLAINEDTGLPSSEDVLAVIKSRSEFVKSGISGDGCVWGHFSNGELFIVMNNLEGIEAMQLEKDEDSRRSLHLNLPTDTTDFYAYGALGEGHSVGQSAVTKMLSEFYTTQDATGRVENLKDPLGFTGIFYVTGHGGLATDANDKDVFAVSTNTEINTNNDQAYQDDLREGRLVRVAELTIDKDHHRRMVSRYAFTAKFVNEYMEFAGNSLMVLSVCSGMSNEAADFRAACYAKGISVICGWDAPVRSGDAVAADVYLFDRLLGVNETHTLILGTGPVAIVPLVLPRLRPFGIEAVFTAMQQQTKKPGLSAGSPRSNYVTSISSHGTSTLSFQRNVAETDSQGFGQLRPSIHYLEVSDFGRKLRIHGTGLAGFGDDRGPDIRSVEIGGVKLGDKVTTWEDDLIEIDDLPSTGPGSTGVVVVKVGDIPSNPRHLTKWNLMLHQRFMDYPTQQSTDCPDCFYDATLSYAFRGDAGGTRLNLLDEVSPPAFTGGASEGDFSVTDAGGSYNIGQGTTITLSPNPIDGAELIGTCVGFLPPEDNNYFGACFYLNGAAETIKFSPTIFAEGLFRNYSGGQFDGTVDPYQAVYFGNSLDKELVLSLTPEFGIIAGQQSTGPSSYFEWENADAISPPELDDPR